MLKNPNKWLLVILIFTFLKGLIWLWFIPIFQAPDENTHWGMTQYFAENLSHPGTSAIVATKELIAVAKIVRFNWVESHPVWQGLEDNWFNQLKQLDPSLKNQFVIRDTQAGQKLPQLYFWFNTPIYRLFFNQSFLVRFYALRAVSVLLGVLTVFLGYLSARMLFNPGLSLAVASLIAMQPTLSVIFSSITYDSLTVVAASLFTYLSLKYYYLKKPKWLFYSLITICYGFLIKPQLIALIIPWIYLLFPKYKRYSFLSLFIIILAWSFPPARFVFNQLSQFFGSNLLILIKEYIFQNAKAFSAEIFPWYWGVFGWLEKTMPIWTYRILKIITAISLIGLIKVLINSSKNRRQLWFLIILNLAVILVIFANDFIIFTQRQGTGFGVQGRYFLPAVISQMILLVFGIKTIVPEKFHKKLSYLIIFFSLGINLIGLNSVYQYFGK